MQKTIITTFDQFQDWALENWRPIMALDWETDSLSYLEMNPMGFSLANDTAVAYVNLLNNESLSILKRLRGLILDSMDLLICHNSCFDLKCLKKFCNCEPKNIFCSLVGAQLINENLPSYSLKYLAEHWLNVPPEQIKKWEEVKDSINSNDYIDYAMNDAVWAYQLFELESKELKKQNLEYLAYKIEFPFQFVLRDLEINGIAVDRKQLNPAREQIWQLMESYQIQMCEEAEIDYWYDADLSGNKWLRFGVNFNSSDQLIPIIEKMGFEITERSKKEKKKSLCKKTKLRLKSQCKFVDLLYRYGKLEKLYSSFLEPCEDFIDSDGRIRPSYHMVRTGRLACSEPNLQQLPNPKREKLDFNYRKIFIPGE